MHGKEVLKSSLIHALTIVTNDYPLLTIINANFDKRGYTWVNVLKAVNDIFPNSNIGGFKDVGRMK